jgi:predicted unusual protein kinase regulating ubiquinone biosynthesis (AarF/ABC1/UbiB family)
MPNQTKLKPVLNKQSPVPSGRLTRFAKFGLLTTGIAGSMLVNGAKRLASGQRLKVTDLLLTPANAKRVVQQLAQMRGAAMKLGQLLSMDAGDIIPPELAKILSALRADADAMPSEQVQQVLIDHWGKAWTKRVKSFDFDSVAAASIGQVHRAIAKNGDALAIKLQYPGVRKSIDSDVDNVASLLRFSGLVPSDIDLKPFLKDAKKQLHNEANYLREGQFLQRFHDLLKDDEAFCVPQWFETLSTTDVLAMTFVDSVPIEDMIHAPQDQRNAIVRNLLALFLREVLEFRMVQTDPNFANYRYCLATQQIVLLDFGAVHEYTQAFSSQFKKLIKSALSQNKEKMQAAAASLGYFSETTEARHKAMILAIFDVSFEAQCFEGEYDFAATDLAARLNPLAFELMKDRDFWEVPPTPVLLLQRKIAGLFLLAVKLNAKVNVNEIVKSAVMTTTKIASELPAKAA